MKHTSRPGRMLLVAALPLVAALAACQPRPAVQAAAPGPQARVELDVFSGRPNPAWDLNASQVAQFAGLLAALPEAPAAAPPGQLGYRGFIVQLSDPATTVQVYDATVWVTAGAETAHRADQGRALERWLLATADRSQVDAEVLAMIENELTAAPSPAAGDDEFGIYTWPGLIPGRLPEGGLLPPDAVLVVSTADIVSYTWESHTLELEPAAYRRIDVMLPPTSGTAFAACVGRECVYTGAFWPAYSSQSYGGVVINVAPVWPGAGRIQISLGYPGGDFFEGTDPRGDPRIREALERAGKLR